MYKRIRALNNTKPLRTRELRTISREEIEDFKKNLNPLKRAGVEVVE